MEDQKDKYISCSALHFGLNFYRSNIINICCFSLSEELFITENSSEITEKDLIKAIYKKKLQVVNEHKEGKLGVCKNCVCLQSQRWIVSDLIHSIALNHYLTCNLACTHCGYRSSDPKYFDSDENLVLDTIKKLNNAKMLSGDCNFHIGGGEPSINKKLKTTIQYLLENNRKIFINSNATHFISLFVQGVQKGLVTLILTPDAGSRDIYKKIKKADLFEQVWQNIGYYTKMLQDKVLIKFIIEDGNKDDVENMVIMCKKHNVSKIMLDFDLNITQKDFHLYENSIRRFFQCASENGLNVEVGSLLPREFFIKPMP